MASSVLSRLRVTCLLLLLTAPLAHGQTLLHTFESPSPQHHPGFGQHVAAVPDLDGDGRADLIVSAPNFDDGPLTGVGLAVSFSSATGLALDTLFSPNQEQGGKFGSAIAGLDDRDGDGRGEYLIGAPAEDMDSFVNAGRAYVIAGITEDADAHVSPAPESFLGFGSDVAAVPDVDGNGRMDYLVTAGGATVGDVEDAGRVYLFSGTTGALLHSFVSPNIEAEGGFGRALAGVPDSDGDGAGDILVGAWQENVGEAEAAGRVYLFSGATGALLHTLTSPDPTSLGFGNAVAGVSDVDGDGRGDLLVGARYESVGAFASGRAYLFSGATGDLLHTLSSPNPTINGNFGNAVAGVPDVDGDDRSDLLIGAASENVVSEVASSGRVYLFSGGTGALLLTLVSPDATPGNEFGRDVAGMPDVDGDGRGDLLIGAEGERVGPVLQAGRAYLFTTGAIVADEPDPSAAAPALRLAVAPNPTRGAATITFDLARPGAARLVLFDVLGREVAALSDGPRTGGVHAVTVDTRRLSPGIYVARLVTDDAAAAVRLTVVH